MKTKSRAKKVLGAVLSLGLLNMGSPAPYWLLNRGSQGSMSATAGLFARGPLAAASALLGALLSPPDAAAQTFEIMNKLLVDGSSTFKGATLFVATTAPTAYAGTGTIYYDQSANALEAENNGAGGFAPLTLQGNTFNGTNELVQLNGSGQLPALSGTNLTNLQWGQLTGGLPVNCSANNYVSGIGSGGTLTCTVPPGTGLTSVTTNATLAGNGTGGSPLGLNLGNANAWTGTQSFSGEVGAIGGGTYGFPSKTSQGGYISWDNLTGQGEMDFLNNEGGGSGGFAFFNANSAGVVLSTPVVISGSGNVGIGTTNPLFTLEVNGKIINMAAYNGNNNLNQYDLGVNTVGAGSSIYSYGLICAGNATAACTGANGVVIDGSGSNVYGNTYLTGSGNSYFDGGNVGIGTTSPVADLEVHGGSMLDSSGGSVYHYRNVLHYYDGTASVTGTLEIIMPNGWTNTMLQATIRGYDYTANGAWEVRTGGYNYASTPAWYNTSADISGRAPFNEVRLAYDSSLSKNVILLGTTSTVWAYPAIDVADFVASYSNQTSWGSGWSAAFLTSEGNIADASAPAIDLYDSAGAIGVGTTAPNAGAGNLTVAGTTFFGTGSTYQVTSGGAATLAGDVCTTAAGGLVPCNGNNHGTIGTSAPDAWASVYAYDIYGNMHPGAPDLAERYPGDVAPGDVVVLSREPQKNATVLDQSSVGPHDSPAGASIPVAVEKSNVPYQADIFGVVSTAPGIELSDPKDESNPPIALTGRVPVKVDLEGGPIKIGDYLTSSSRPGYAMKATGPGATVGIALENFGTDETEGNGKTGKILCFVHVGEDASLYKERLDQEQSEINAQNGVISDLRLQLNRLEERLGDGK